MLKRVCVIGAGAAGLIAIRHIKDDPNLEGCVFEQNDAVGGIWNYTDDTGINKYGIPVHSTAYKGLRTNLPKDIMGFLDSPFPESNYTYISHDEVLGYLKRFAEDHQLESLIHFTTRVLSIEPTDSSTPSTTWKVKTENLKTKKTCEHEFDSVIICNGHYTKPYLPEIKNLEEFKGEVWHSRDYRKPDPFLGKKVIILGGGPSAIDISLEVMEFTPDITLSCKKDNYYLPHRIRMSSPVVTAKSNSFLTETGEEVECDVILLCSGYQYDFPFLLPSCGVTVEKGKYVYPLYRHLINAKFPSMAFIGIPFTVCPFPQFDIQVRYFLEYLKGDIELPPEDVMLCEIKEEEEMRREKGIPLNHSHKFGDAQWEYNRKLAEEAGCSELIKPVTQLVYDRAGERRLDNPYQYKSDYVEIINHELFVYVEDAFPYL